MNSKKPTAVITFKGNYSGVNNLYFTISPKSIKSDAITVDNTPLYSAVKTSVQKLKPIIKDGNKRLVEGTDYKLEYPNTAEGSYITPGIYDITVNGYGNYQGTIDLNEEIISKQEKLISKAIVKPILPMTYDGNPKEPKPVVTFSGVKEALKEGIDYKVSYSTNHTDIGTASVIITGIGEYKGVKVVNYNITGTALSKATIEGIPKSLDYTGDALTFNDDLYLYIKATSKTSKIELKENQNYKVYYDKNTDAGTASILLVGINGYSGSVKKTFKINPIDSNANLTVDFADNKDTFPYRKGGVEPSVVVKYGDNILIKDADYTLKYSYNKAVNDKDAYRNAPTVTITGKKNFKNSIAKKFTISSTSITQASIIADDVNYSKTGGRCKSAVKVVDVDGKALVAGTDYFRTITYKYKYVPEGSEYKAGFNVGPKDAPPVGTIITAEVSGLGNYMLSPQDLSADYRIIDSANNISSGTFKIRDQIYEGEEIELDDEDFLTASIGPRNNTTNLTYGEDYVIVPGSYVNNIKKGNASVTIKGVGVYGGRKNLTFKILGRN